MFVIKIRLHTTLKYSLFPLLYHKHLVLFFDENFVKSIEITNSTEKHETRRTKLQHVKLAPNKNLLIRAIYVNNIRYIQLDSHISIKVKHWMLIKHGKKQKLETKWYNFYKILNHYFLKTYRIILSNNEILKSLFNDNKFFETNMINDIVKFDFRQLNKLRFENKTKLLNHQHRK